jgi:amino acid adenylation domain-containing protein
MKVPMATIPHSVYQQAISRPNGIAIVEEGRSTTYSWLVTRADQLRHEMNVGQLRGANVIVMMPRGADFIASALAVMAEGGAYIPIDIAQPAERIRSIIQDSGAALILTTAATQLPQNTTAQVLVIDSLGSASTYGPEPIRAAITDIAYVIYTSGTQGLPKGVEIEHAALRNLVDWHVSAYGVTSMTRSLHTASLSFDAAVWEIWPYLSCGASIVVAPDEVRSMPSRLVGYSRKFPVELCFLPTPIAEEVVASHAQVGWKLLLTGGDKLRLRELPNRFQLVNHYGPTEATVVTTSYRVGEITSGSTVPIGRPISGVEVLLRASSGECGRDVLEGEICIGGTQVARGYRDRPGLTAEKFVSIAGQSGRWYRSGDLARWLPGRELEFLGRIDEEQIKVRGVRVEMTEIESALLRLPKVENAAVVQLGEGSSAILVALIKCTERPLSVREMRARLSFYLPMAIVPNRFISVESLPLTVNGKLDRVVLRQMAARSIG